ncbi:MAG: hypothetical protein ACWA5U_01985 [bacterium]
MNLEEKVKKLEKEVVELKTRLATLEQFIQFPPDAENQLSNAFKQGLGLKSKE